MIVIIIIIIIVGIRIIITIGGIMVMSMILLRFSLLFVASPAANKNKKYGAIGEQ